MIQAEKLRHMYITTVRAKYGTTDVATSKRLRRSDGCSCGAIEFRQKGRPESKSALDAAEVGCEMVVTVGQMYPRSPQSFGWQGSAGETNR